MGSSITDFLDEEDPGWTELLTLFTLFLRYKADPNRVVHLPDAKTKEVYTCTPLHVIFQVMKRERQRGVLYDKISEYEKNIHNGIEDLLNLCLDLGADPVAQDSQGFSVEQTARNAVGRGQPGAVVLWAL